MTRSVTAVLLTASLLGSAAAPRYDKRIAKDQEALHALSRLTFGPRPGDVEAVYRTGVKKWIEQQLNPEAIAEPAELEARLKPLSSLVMTQAEIAEEYPPRQLIKAFANGKLPLPKDPGRRAMVERLIDRYENRKKAAEPSADRTGMAKLLADPDIRALRKASPEEREQMLESMPAEKVAMLRKVLPGAGGKKRFAYLPVEQRRAMLAQTAPQQLLAHDLYEQKMYRAVYSNRQLEEILTDFWFNHFNVYLDKGAVRQLATSYERDAIRPHVLGKFQDLLRATAAHPAMLFYLDNWQSVAANAPRRGKKSRGLNENYARELLELHSLGVDGGYTQKDVMEVARCFTGWTIGEPYRGAAFVFNPRVHDDGEKTVLGVRIPSGGGKDDGLKVLEIVARHPSTARFISTKLAQRFVADAPPETLIRAMAEKFRKTDGDIREVMRTMLQSREFWSEAAYRSKIKSPFEMVASALRATGADVSFGFGVATRVGELGQPLYRKQEPTGYSNKGSEWVNSAALLGRMNFALDLMQNKLPGVKVDVSRYGGDPKELAKGLLFSDPTPQTRTAIDRGAAEKKEPAVTAGLVLGSPEFQRR